MNNNNDETDLETLKQLLATTREKLFNVILINLELETALKIERSLSNRDINGGPAS